MSINQLHKQAAAESRDGSTRFVVYVFDQGTEVFNAEQARIFGPLVMIEATYLAGALIASQAVATQ
jgi:hypothetical protein